MEKELAINPIEYAKMLEDLYDKAPKDAAGNTVEQFALGFGVTCNNDRLTQLLEIQSFTDAGQYTSPSTRTGCAPDGEHIKLEITAQMQTPEYATQKWGVPFNTVVAIHTHPFDPHEVVGENLRADASGYFAASAQDEEFDRGWANTLADNGLKYCSAQVYQDGTIHARKWEKHQNIFVPKNMKVSTLEVEQGQAPKRRSFTLGQTIRDIHNNR